MSQKKMFCVKEVLNINMNTTYQGFQACIVNSLACKWVRSSIQMATEFSHLSF